MSITRFEKLSNGLLCEIFDYLDGYKLYKAFSNLNSRFEQFHHSSYVLYKTQVCSFKYEEVMNMFKQFVFPNRHQILSIHINFTLRDSYLFSWVFFDKSFDRLEYLSVRIIQTNTLILVLRNLSSLPCICSLKIETSDVKEELNEIYRLTFILSKLKSYKILSFNNHYSITIPMAMNNRLSSIEYLTIDHYCSLNELASLISYVPELRCLTVYKTDTNDSNSTILTPVTLTNLKSICLHMYQITFNELEIFLVKISSNLKILSINSSNDISFLDAHRWENFLLHYYPQLEKFYLSYYDRMDNNNQYEIYSGRINQFSSSFWTERKWIFHAEIKFVNVGYIIQPYRKRWYDDDARDNNVNCCIEYSKLSGFTIACTSGFMFEGAIQEKIQRILTITQIYHLEILEEKVSTSLLLKVVNLLPETTSIKMHSFLPHDITKLTKEELLILSSVMKARRITKLYVEELYGVHQLDFLFILWPCTEYFKFGCINAMDVQSFLHTILKNINRNINYQHLRSLRVHVPTADDLMVKHVEDMIKCEELLHQFTVKRIVDDIYLQWK